MIGRFAGCVLLLAITALESSAQITVALRDAGEGPGPRILQQALAAPHLVIRPDTSQFLVGRDSGYSRTLIVLGRKTVVEGRVHGDVVVVGGDLFMHPGGRIDGRAVALGGGVYESMLATIGGGLFAFRDFTYDITATASGYALSYRSLEPVDSQPAFRLAGLYGLWIPSYDRTDGLSLPLAVTVQVPKTRITLDPRLTYRSQLGRLDPSIVAVDSLSHSTALTVSVARGTYSNDAWIRSDPINSLHVFAFGNDTRNYFRGVRGDAVVAMRSEGERNTIVPYVGGRIERAWPTRPGVDATGGPWSITGRHGADDMLRPNPAVDSGGIVSVLTGLTIDWSSDEIVAHAALDVEAAHATLDPISGFLAGTTRRFAQATFDGVITFPTFGTQSLRFDGHAVFTTPGSTPRQRWAYLGGSGTLPPLEMLELGGDQLLYIDGRYNIPIERVQLPMIGAPVVTLRDALGGADVRRAPAIHQAVGLRISASALYAEFMIDPVTHQHHTGFGLSLSR